ncbi:MAG: hypothetical protein KAU38_02005 [Desulfobacterales bacterium]|nr:hypothetical protein [Desulfobacterales bacterium]
MPTHKAMAGRGYNAHTQGNLPAIATHAGIEAASCTWRWQAGGGQVRGTCCLSGTLTIIFNS